MLGCLSPHLVLIKGRFLMEKKTEVKRSEIIKCPYFRLSSFVIADGRKSYDMYCKLDFMIFTTYRVESDNITDNDKKAMQDCMRCQCALECPKMWTDPIDDELDEFSKFDEDYYDDPFDEPKKKKDKKSKRDYYSESLTEERDYLLHGWKEEIKDKKNLPAKIEKHDERLRKI